MFTHRLPAAFQTREAALLLAMCFVIDFGLALFQVPFAVALVQVHGWDAGSLSRVQAGLALLGGTLGALDIGAIVDRIGPRPARQALRLACTVAFGIAGSLIAAGLAAGAGSVILGLASVVPAPLYVAVLLASREGRASAVQFQVHMAAVNLGDVTGAALAGALGASTILMALTVASVFLLCARAAHAPRPGSAQ